MSLWGPLAARFETERPRKLLALDGGGIRGALTLEAAGLGDIDPERVAKMDAVDQIENLLRIGRNAARHVDVRAFGSFVA